MAEIDTTEIDQLKADLQKELREKYTVVTIHTATKKIISIMPKTSVREIAIKEVIKNGNAIKFKGFLFEKGTILKEDTQEAREMMYKYGEHTPKEYLKTVIRMWNDTEDKNLTLKEFRELELFQ